MRNPLATYLAARFSHRPHTPPPEPSKVNPGAPNDSGPRAPKIDPGESIVINPVTEASGQSREMSAELAALLRDHIRKNPVGTPSGNPGEPE